MSSSLLLTLLVSIGILVICFAFGFILIRRDKRISELEALLNQADSIKRAHDVLKRQNDLDQARFNENEAKFSGLQKDLSTARADLDVSSRSNSEKDKQIKEMAAQVQELESAQKRARDAEGKLIALQKEYAAFRGEWEQSHKRVEAAESASRDKQIQFERIEATLEAKDKVLVLKQNESADLARELDERRTEISELVVERDKLLSMEAALKEKLNSIEDSFKGGERSRQKLNDEFTECRLELAETKEKFNRLNKMYEEQLAIGENNMDQIKKLGDQLLEVEDKLARKEAAFKDLELAHRNANEESPYEAHKHMEWTLNHFDPKAITFKFNNLGAKVFLVDVQTDIPQIRHEFETGREIPRDEDFESRIKLAIKKSEQKNMEEMPGEFDMTVFYALNIYPIKFKIRPREGQKIVRIKKSDAEGESGE